MNKSGVPAVLANSCHGVIARRAVHIRNAEVRAFLGEDFSNGPANAMGSASDNGYFVCESAQ